MSPEAFSRRCQRIYAIGCLPCRMRGFKTPCQVHHLNLGGHAGQERRGDEFTIGLCPYHHVGDPINGRSIHACTSIFGPSMKLRSKAFREEFGSDDDLLAEQNRRIAILEQQVVGATPC